jgi:hypothetical protein
VKGCDHLRGAQPAVDPLNRLMDEEDTLVASVFGLSFLAAGATMSSKRSSSFHGGLVVDEEITGTRWLR